ncbi:hypothetical protein LYSHEL_26840 [Lysobacter helvus]|uniref:DUF2185 domain-containing protein n=2 Tax=Lysobacteraceae TaxID=32033 RepID=A0ABN6FVC2_9GAMM|nr:MULTISPECIES: hypothetical protein [Lysobacter]BCT93657.1 hypothetical protein LYSCAS_26810 [Lysobacter caseinilyticus]BCT96813.1 hypothetical protein LYSHEL_26840 [Lysobacter helvus]
METVEVHPLSFSSESWPFADPINTLAYASGQVLNGSPILLVFHDHDGEWQFLTGEDREECKIICLGCAFERDAALAGLAAMPIGWMAYRASIDKSWQCEPYEDSDGVED